jgi:hypothetical protein
MIPRTDLRKIGHARLKDAEALYKSRRYDGAVYLCGYAIEAMLKARICRTLKWDEFPLTRGEFQSYQSLRTHDLGVLLKLSGVEGKIKTECLNEWVLVTNWTPEMRYNPIGTAQRRDTLKLIEATKVLVKAL